MSDLIDRQAAIDAFFMELCFNKEREYAIGYNGIEKIINRLPSAEKTGKWTDRGSLSCRCSECGCKSPKEYTYCPNCGALMVDEVEE